MSTRWGRLQHAPAASSVACPWGIPLHLCPTASYRKVGRDFFMNLDPVLYSSLEWGGDARTRDECQARGAGRAGPACPPSVRPSHGGLEIMV